MDDQGSMFKREGGTAFEVTDPDALLRGMQVTTFDGSIQEAFEAFHVKHPEVYTGLVRLARQGIAANRSRLGIGQLFEVLRWSWRIAGLPDEDEAWKLNNNYRSRYARLIMEQEPDLDDIFETRELTAP